MSESNTDPSSVVNLSPGLSQPPRTREGASQYVFDKILRLNTSHQQPLALAFQLSGITLIPDVMSLTQNQIDQMTFRDGKGSKVQDLPTGFKSCVVVFQHYVRHVIERLGRRLTIDDWYKLDEIDFSEYRIYVYNPNSVVKSLLRRPTLRVDRRRSTHNRCRIFPSSETLSPTSSVVSNAILPPLFR